MKKTKIVCTLGPASDNKEVLKSMVHAGMNVARFNFSHGSHEEQGKKMDLVRSVNEELNANLGLLLDTKGPEVRTHHFEGGKVTVQKGTEVRVCMNEVLGTATKFSVTYPGLIDDLEVGGTVLVDDGYLELTVTGKDTVNKELITMAKNTHAIKDRRGVNIPGVALKMEFISEKDRSDIEFGCDQDVDYIAASFVQNAQDIMDIKAILERKGKLGQIQIIAKIESVEGVKNISSIIDVCDGIMVARGDLGVEVPAWDVPVIQKQIIEECHSKGKFVITATQMLESMQQNPRPTRAEVSDVANAVLDGTDCVMLSGESAAGQYPVESVTMMANICLRTEEEMDHGRLINNALTTVDEENEVPYTIALAVSDAANHLGAGCIVTPSASGITSRLISKFRPVCPIITITESRKVARSLACNWGVYPVIQNFAKDFDSLVEQCRELAKESCNLETGDRVILSAGLPIGKAGTTNTMRILAVK